MIKHEKVNWYDEELDDFYAHENNGYVWGIYTYEGEDRLDVTWYKAEEERDFAYHLHSGIADRIGKLE